MAKAIKYYAVAVGRDIGIYTNWNDCKKQVDGYPGAKYKSFASEEEAKQFIFSGGDYDKFKGIGGRENLTELSKKINAENKKERKKLKAESNKDLEPIRSTANVKFRPKYIEPNLLINKDKKVSVAFVDGSYNRENKLFGSGVAYISETEDKITIEEYKIAGPDIHDQWNIVGELEASKLAIFTAVAKKDKKIYIYHDLKNIGLWASGEWKAKNEYTQDYVAFIEEMSKLIDIEFIKVKGHSDNVYNDIADRLAGESIKDYLKNK